MLKTIIHEGRSSIVFKGMKKETGAPVSIRVFTEKSGVDERVAFRLEQELEELKCLPRLPVFWCVYDLGGTVMGIFRRYVP